MVALPRLLNSLKSINNTIKYLFYLMFWVIANIYLLFPFSILSASDCDETMKGSLKVDPKKDLCAGVFHQKKLVEYVLQLDRIVLLTYCLPGCCTTPRQAARWPHNK